MVTAGQVWDALAECNYWWLIPSIAFLFVAQVVRALRWQSLSPAAPRPRSSTSRYTSRRASSSRW